MSIDYKDIFKIFLKNTKKEIYIMKTVDKWQKNIDN